MIQSSIEAELKEKGMIIYPNKGTSMEPLIKQGRDLLVIVRPENWDHLEDTVNKKLKKYDVPLYKRDNSGHYVLHRVLQVRKDGYVICGDHLFSKEYGISDKQVVGVLTAIIRKEKKISLDDKRYQLYVFVWCHTFYLRKLLNKIKGRICHAKKD